MICPRIAARIKQHRDAPGEGIYAGKVRPFVPVAMHTGEREVFQVGDSAMLAWNDVIDVESGWIQVEGHMAVLTLVSSTSPDLPQ